MQVLIVMACAVMILMVVISFTAVPRRWTIERNGRDTEAVVMEVIYSGGQEYVLKMADALTGQCYRESGSMPMDIAVRTISCFSELKGSIWQVKVLGNEAIRIKRKD